MKNKSKAEMIRDIKKWMSVTAGHIYDGHWLVNSVGPRGVIIESMYAGALKIKLDLSDFFRLYVHQYIYGYPILFDDRIEIEKKYF